MKIPFGFAAVLFAATCVFAETSVAPAETTEKPKVVQQTPDRVPKPAAKTQEKPKVEKEPVIPGMTLVRPNGTFLGFEASGGKWKISFYDKKKKPMALDVTRGLARWANPRGLGDLRSALNPSGTALISDKPALPPFNYNVYITLLQGDGDNAKTVETYAVIFRG